MSPASGSLILQGIVKAGTGIPSPRYSHRGTDSMAAECVVEINQVPSIVHANGHCSFDEPTIRNPYLIHKQTSFVFASTAITDSLNFVLPNNYSL